MDASRIKKHLKSHSIHSSRVTTIRSAFAASMARAEAYDAARVADAIERLGQDPDALTCIYCLRPANGWDHLEALVRDGEPSGAGHTLGNLVPACGDCNSHKRSTPWTDWMKHKGRTSRDIARVRRHTERFASGGRLLADPKFTRKEIGQLVRAQSQIIASMKEADAIIKTARARAGRPASKRARTRTSIRKVAS